jgi:hypothetical protein
MHCVCTDRSKGYQYAHEVGRCSDERHIHSGCRAVLGKTAALVRKFPSTITVAMSQVH